MEIGHAANQKPACLTPREGVGRQGRPERPAEGGGQHPQGRNEEEDAGRSHALRPAAAGLVGSAAQAPTWVWH
jgi:hypothetical protein